MHKKIIFVFNSGPIFGRAVPITGAIFSWFREEDYVFHLNKAVTPFGWAVEKDSTEANIEEIKTQAEIIVCAPGIRWQFYTDGFDKKRIIYLSTMEYATNDTRRVLKLLISIISNERSDYEKT